VRVSQFAAPTYDEKRHHFLWRFWPKLPGWGGMSVFDRSWYGRVLVERVEKLTPKKDWQRAYREINEFERQLVDNGFRVVKIFLHISKEQQRTELIERMRDPLKRWKLSFDDFRNRARWSDYVEAIEDMFDRTNTTAAPWHVVPSDDKPAARAEALRILAKQLSKGLDLSLPPLDRKIARTALKMLGKDALKSER
jgi:polyphosphate kinase 2 (PPK2 family)